MNDHDDLGFFIGCANAIAAEGIVILVCFLGAVVYMNVHAIMAQMQ